MDGFMSQTLNVFTGFFFYTRGCLEVIHIIIERHRQGILIRV